MRSTEEENTTISVPEKVELDRITFRGHENILGTHKNTIEITKDPEISKRADCIIGVSATKSCLDLNPILKEWILSSYWLEFEIITAKNRFRFTGRGSPDLELSDERELVLRRSDYLSPRTASILCSDSAIDIPRPLVDELKDPHAVGLLIIRAFGKRNTNEDSFIWTLP